MAKGVSRANVCLWHLLRRPRMSALRPLSGGGQSGPQPAAGPRLRAHGQNSSCQDDPSRREPRVLAPALARRCALWPRLWPGSDPLLPHAATRRTRRHAASPMTLVDAHRAARRDSPVLPVRIFPSVSRDPIRGERPSSADATETPWSCQVGPLAYGGADPRRASRG